MQINISDFASTCVCNKVHKIEVEVIYIEKGAIHHIKEFLEKKNIQKVALICDSNTYDAAGAYIIESFEKRDPIIRLEAEGLHADEKSVQKVLDGLKDDVEALLAVGSGTIHDTTRYVAHKLQIPFISVPTAASVDGFVSTVSAMTWEGFKVTYPGVSPIAVFADTDIFSKAPYRLTAAGVGDLLGKYTALLDWKIAHLVTGEYLCEKIVQIEEDAIGRVIRSLDGLLEGEEKAYESLMYALLLSGLAMQMVGNSRPASGSEHHMSHLWEMHVINDEVDALHGEKVGVASGIVCDIYKKILSIESVEDYVIDYKGLPEEQLEATFQQLYHSIKEENKVDLLAGIQKERLISCFNEIKELIRVLPTGDEMRVLLKKVGGKVELEDIGLLPSVLEESIEYSPYVRARLTWMRLLKLINGGS